MWVRAEPMLAKPPRPRAMSHLTPNDSGQRGRGRTRLGGGLGLLLWLSLVSLVTLLGAGCAMSNSSASETASGGAAAGKPGAPADDRIAVAALPLRRGAIEAVLRYSTHLEAEDAVSVHAEASRKVVQLLVEEGDAVQKGQPLLRLEDEVQQSNLAKVEMELEQARREYQRQQRLYQQALISEQAHTEARYRLEQLELQQADVQRELSYALVRAPISGVVTERLVGVGDYVQTNQHLFDVVDFDSIVARVFVPEHELHRLAIGQAARLRAQGVGEATFAARIERIAPVVDPKSGTVKVTLDVPPAAALMPGRYVELELVAETRTDALLVPKRALLYDEEEVFVFRVRSDDTVERLRIVPAIEHGHFVAVDSGVAAGDRIVVAGQAGLKSGARVRLLDLAEALATFGDPAQAAAAGLAAAP